VAAGDGAVGGAVDVGWPVPAPGLPELRDVDCIPVDGADALGDDGVAGVEAGEFSPGAPEDEGKAD
jgi:hypothetical protein